MPTTLSLYSYNIKDLSVTKMNYRDKFPAQLSNINMN